MAAMIGDALKTCKASSGERDGNPGKPNLLQVQESGAFCQGLLRGTSSLCLKCSIKGKDSWHWKFDCPCSQRGTWLVKILHLLKLEVTEEAEGVLCRLCGRSSPLMRNLG
jgi:hypothetical protein